MEQQKHNINPNLISKSKVQLPHIMMGSDPNYQSEQAF